MATEIKLKMVDTSGGAHRFIAVPTRRRIKDKMIVLEPKPKRKPKGRPKKESDTLRLGRWEAFKAFIKGGVTLTHTVTGHWDDLEVQLTTVK